MGSGVVDFNVGLGVVDFYLGLDVVDDVLLLPIRKPASAYWKHSFQALKTAIISVKLNLVTPIFGNEICQSASNCLPIETKVRKFGTAHVYANRGKSIEKSLLSTIFEAF